MNQMRFSTTEYDDDSKVSEESRLVWIPITSKLRQEAVYQIKLTDLELQDKYYQFSAVTEDKRQIFSNSYMMTRPYERENRVHVQVTFEFDLTLYLIDRDVYSYLDWIGDVGGLNEGIFLLLKVILLSLQFFDLEHLLIENLYRQSKK